MWLWFCRDALRCKTFMLVIFDQWNTQIFCSKKNEKRKEKKSSPCLGLDQTLSLSSSSSLFLLSLSLSLSLSLYVFEEGGGWKTELSLLLISFEASLLILAWLIKVCQTCLIRVLSHLIAHLFYSLINQKVLRSIKIYQIF
jgi:hypothetical protein